MKSKYVPVPVLVLVAAVLLPACGGGGDGDNGNNDNGNHGNDGTATGPYWSVFSVPDPGCIDVGGVQVCGPSRVDRIEVTEKSTAEILGACNFGDKNTASTGTLAPGYEFTCERTPGAMGGAEIKISSAQANLPIIHAYHHRIEDNLPMWETYTEATGGLNGSDGAVYADPYQRKEFQFAGFKSFTFATTADKDYEFFRQHALQPLLDAGYEAAVKHFQATSPGFVGLIDVYDTLDGRAKLGSDVIGRLWRERAADTEGNKGTYDYVGKYQGTTKATMTYAPPLNTVKIWESTADATFEHDPDINFGAGVTAFNTTGGTVTQTIYTVPQSQVPGYPCYGNPATFTDTYNIVRDDGYLSLTGTGTDLQYSLTASLSATSAPIQAHTYEECCAYRTPACETKTIEPGAQEHSWLFMNHEFRAVEADGSIKGSYSWQNGANSFEWDLAPADQ